MITRVKVKNYRSLAEVDVRLSPLTVLVGPNGSGKSNFVDVLRFVSEALRLGLDQAVMKRGGITSLRRWSSGRPYDVEISLTVENDNFYGEYVLTLASGRGGAYRVKREFGFCRGKDAEGEFEIRNGKWITPPPLFHFFEKICTDLKLPIPDSLSFLFEDISPISLGLPIGGTFPSSPPTITINVPPFDRLYDILWQMGFYTIFPNALREPQKPANPYPLEEHGANLASVLRDMKKKGKWWPDLTLALGAITEGITDLKVEQVGGYLATYFKHEVEGEKAHWFDALQESDGTLRVLGLLTALYQDPPPSLLAMEEPELTVHPGALDVLYDVLNEAATKRTQVLLTTHSPDLISQFSVDQLRAVELVQGITEIGEVHEVQRQALKEKLFSAGDLLRIEGLRRQTEPVES